MEQNYIGLSLLFLAIILLGVVYRLSPNQENFVSGTDYDLNYQNDRNNYFQQEQELGNFNNVLLRNRQPGKKEINNIQTTLTTGLADKNDKYGRLHEGSLCEPDDNPPNKVLGMFEKHQIPEKLEECVTDKKVWNNIVKFQPDIYGNKPHVINYYGRLFYHDWRYPLQPINIRFASNPKKFVEQYPQEYPSYVILSRKDIK